MSSQFLSSYFAVLVEGQTPTSPPVSELVSVIAGGVGRKALLGSIPRDSTLRMC